jgi:hypothetical protein
MKQWVPAERELLASYRGFNEGFGADQSRTDPVVKKLHVKSGAKLRKRQKWVGNDP